MVEETQKEKTGEEAAQQGTVLVCGNHHTHVGKTRQDMGMGGHTGKKDVGHTRGKGKGEDKAWLSQRHSPHRKRKRQKDNEHLKTIKSIA